MDTAARDQTLEPQVPPYVETPPMVKLRLRGRAEVRATPRRTRPSSRWSSIVRLVRAWDAAPIPAPACHLVTADRTLALAYHAMLSRSAVVQYSTPPHVCM